MEVRPGFRDPKKGPFPLNKGVPSILCPLNRGVPF